MKLALALTVVLLTPGGEKLDQHPWRKFGSGAWTRTAITDTRGPALTVVERVVKTSKSSYTLESLHHMQGIEDFTQEREVDYAFMGYAHLVPGARVLRSEVLTIMGRRLPCTVWSHEWRDRVGQHEVRTWTSQGVPVPVRVWMDSGDDELDLWLVGRHDPLQIGDEKFACERYEGFLRPSEGPDLDVLQWRSDKVPGGIVMTETRLDDNGPVWKHTARIVAFGPQSDE